MSGPGDRKSFSLDNGTDVYTKLPIEAHTDEHVVQDCLGSPVTIRGIMDLGTNNLFGATIDKALGELLLPARTWLGGKTARGDDLGFVSDDGDFRMVGTKPVRVRKPGAGPPWTQRDAPAGGKRITVGHDTLDAAARLAAHAVRASGVPGAKPADVSVSVVREIPPPIRSSINLTDKLLSRALAKSLFNMAAHAAGPGAVLAAPFDRARAFVMSGTVGKRPSWSGAEPCGLDTRFVLEDGTPCGTPLRCSFQVQGSAEEGSVWGLAVLYGRLPYTCLLSDSWDGPDFGKRLSVGPGGRDWSYSDLGPGDRFVDLSGGALLDRELNKAKVRMAVGRFNAELQRAVVLNSFMEHLGDAEAEGLAGEAARNAAAERLAKNMAGIPEGGRSPSGTEAKAAIEEALRNAEEKKRRRT